jgi:phage baseplate assembly protein W
VTPDGRIALAQFEEDIREAIRIILGTDRGERVMRPDFGAGLNEFVFEPLNSTTIHLVKTRVQEALVKWEPRIDVLDVSVSADALEHNKLLIAVTYRVRATNTQFNLVYPFYLEEGSAG